MRVGSAIQKTRNNGPPKGSGERGIEEERPRGAQVWRKAVIGSRESLRGAVGVDTSKLSLRVRAAS